MMVNGQLTLHNQRCFYIVKKQAADQELSNIQKRKLFTNEHYMKCNVCAEI